MPLRNAVAADSEKAFRQQALRRLQRTAFEMGVMAVAGSVLALLARLLVPTPEYVWLRVLLLPLTALFAYAIVRAPTVRVYGIACMATIATVSFSNYLGALGTDRPLMYFLPAAIIIVLSTSFFWVTLAQWVGGSLVCYAFFLPFVVDAAASRADTVFSVLFAAMALCTGFVSHKRIQDYQRHAFDHECELAELSVTDTLTGARSRSEFLQQAEKVASRARITGAPLTLLYLDIDHFKRLNDSHGHASLASSAASTGAKPAPLRDGCAGAASAVCSATPSQPGRVPSRSSRPTVQAPAVMARMCSSAGISAAPRNCS